MESIQEAMGLLQEKFSGWLEEIILMTPNFILALIIIVAAHYLSKKARALVKSVLNRIVDNEALVNFLGILAQIAVFLFGILVAVKILKLDEVIFSVLAGVGIAGLAIGFAFQDMAANFIAGIALVFRKDYPFRVGDIIETNEHMGVVEDINLRDSVIRTFQGQSIFIPNKLIFEKSVNNYSLLGKRRVDLGVGISYGEDLEKVRQVVHEAIQGVDPRVKDRDAEVFFEDFGDSSINFQVRFWVPFKKQTDYLAARSDAIIRIKKAFDDNGITIPFPIRTLDFGIKGGVRLSQEIKNNSVVKD